MKTLALAALATVAAFASQAEAAKGQPLPMRQAGTLTCNIDPALGFVVGSLRGVDCSYSYYNRKGRIVRESYAGSMSRAGFDIGLTSGQTVSWGVYTKGGYNSRSMLSGAFGGSSADASVVVGAGTQALFGETSTIALQPMAGSGQVGFGIGFGATGLELQRVAPASFTALYH